MKYTVDWWGALGILLFIVSIYAIGWSITAWVNRKKTVVCKVCGRKLDKSEAKKVECIDEYVMIFSVFHALAAVKDDWYCRTHAPAHTAEIYNAGEFIKFCYEREGI